MPIFKNVTENSSGNVGIGTTSPTYRVSTQGTGDHRIYHYNSGTTTSDNAIIQAEVAGDNSGNAFFCAGKTGTVWSLGRNTSTGNFEIRSNFNLANDASSRMIIKTDGSVGIGTTSAAGRFVVYNNNTAVDRAADIWKNHAASGTTYGMVLSATGASTTNIGLYVDATGATNNYAAIFNTGNVGIGTTSPVYKLDVVGDISARGSDPYFILTPTSGTYVFFQKLSTSNGNYLRLYDGTNYSMFWKDTKVGIGTDAPGEKLHVEGAIRVLSNAGARGIYIRAASANTGNIIQFEESDGTQLWEIVGRGYSAANPFYIYKTGGTGSGFRYVINSSGNHTFTGDVTVTGTITESSSKTIKQNINPITDALSIIKNITGYTYDRKDGTATNQSGFIAEEVAEVLPGVVSLDQEGNPSGVQYTKIIAYLVESIKELKSELDELKRQ